MNMSRRTAAKRTAVSPFLRPAAGQIDQVHAAIRFELSGFDATAIACAAIAELCL
jgi:hypothetical protein